ncbi:hypothetical protein [Pontibacter beigongshangensis]|uniref:hypothetical protein n=1 Tax=Pontibacter beigongshangensis TaxID=2574733 RepID=UPI001650BCF6|nr:hypothetical protein [Pontibacter beigongshangensis]
MPFLQKIIPAALLLVFACTPKSDEVTAERINPGNLPADTLLTTPTDGTATSRTDENPELVLPQAVISLLTQQYPGWQQPVLAEEAHEHAREKQQGPFLVKADFDGDNNQDLALQLRYREQVLMLAFTQQDAAWQLHELQRDILFNDRGNLKSLYYLYLAEAGTTVRNTEDYQPEQTRADAIAVAIDDRATIYVYESGAFTAYEEAE